MEERIANPVDHAEVVIIADSIDQSVYTKNLVNGEVIGVDKFGQEDVCLPMNHKDHEKQKEQDHLVKVHECIHEDTVDQGKKVVVKG
ncbi:hypothetical protein TSUD_92540 [Trifolium subterraneum]|uniref:Uncharacterized protein n=1 Tax=Trifolium subterraneum TaxID=3900 RepID=A0A2Z6NZ09_TRISU|nr:hypothetical protein TSUD_92540 [Trifolium subterraneum]